MRPTSKLVVSTLAATLVLAITTETATARRFEVSNQFFRIVWAFMRFSANLDSIECPITLEGSFHSKTFSKVSGELIGLITKASLGTFAQCRNRFFVESIIVLNENQGTHNTLPWHVRYDSFIGDLPSIASIRIQVVGFAYLIVASGASCLYQSTMAKPAFFDLTREVGGLLTNVTPIGSVPIPGATGNGGTCPAEGAIANGEMVSGAPTRLGLAQGITVHLVQ